MNYELAKQLKNAGFVQPSGEAIDTMDGYFLCECSHLSGDPDAKTVFGDTHEKAYKPSLSELIEACGKRFKFLERIQMVDDTDDGIEIWFRCNDNTMTDSHFPEEAVATLWLVLNKK